MQKDVIVTPNVREGIRPLTRVRFSPAVVFGLDFETVRGKPYTLQIQTDSRAFLFYLRRPVDGLWHLLDVVKDRDAEAVRVYVWGASFDFPCLFFGVLDRFKEQDFTTGFEHDGAEGEAYIACGRSFFGRIKWGRYNVELLDGFQFFRTSLAKAGAAFVDLTKYKKPAGLGTRRLKGPAFERYALEDARITREIALVVERKLEAGGLSSCVSASQYASKMFRARFLKRPIPYLPAGVERAAVLSYHGGINWVTEAAPAFFRNVREYDVTSAYPAAFCQLPDFSAKGGKWRRSRRPLSAHGFVKVRFKGGCAFHPWRGHSFETLPDGGDVWITSYEYQAARACARGLRVLDGYYWIDKGGPSPFRAYMEHFFNLKASAPSAVEKEFAKICLNGISGKLVQNQEHGTAWIAGGLWNPAIASLVTGHTRAAIHGYLHKWRGLHAATDSFFTTARVPCKDAARMGGLSFKTAGDLLLLRNKLYIFFKPGTREILKWGLHGFWGTPEMLVDLWKRRKTRYRVMHIYRVREAFIRGKTPLAAETVERELLVDWGRYAEENRAT